MKKMLLFLCGIFLVFTAQSQNGFSRATAPTVNPDVNMPMKPSLRKNHEIPDKALPIFAPEKLYFKFRERRAYWPDKSNCERRVGFI
ncbi:MAG: hypothetical protein M0P47_11010 [Bacteroidales bacterium]|nr:hypothetical protein [Bacteroidales bacterium]